MRGRRPLEERIKKLAGYSETSAFNHINMGGANWV